MPDEIRNQYPEMFKYVDMVIGTITKVIEVPESFREKAIIQQTMM